MLLHYMHIHFVYILWNTSYIPNVVTLEEQKTNSENMYQDQITTKTKKGLQTRKL